MKGNEARYCQEQVMHLGITETFTLLGMHNVSVCRECNTMLEGKRGKDFGKRPAQGT